MSKIKSDGRVDYGKNLQEIRLAAGYTQEQAVAHMATDYGVSIIRETLSQIERGERHITASELKALKGVYNTTYEEILKDNIE